MTASSEKESGEPHFFTSLERNFPEHAATIHLANNVVSKGLAVLDTAYPVGKHMVEEVEKASSAMERHHLTHLIPVFFGFVICFFGGFFTMLIAAVEIVRITSWDIIKTNMQAIYENYCAALEANRKDDQVDDNQNGIPDVQEITRNELFSRKLGVFMNSVDPVGLHQAIRALLFAFFAVLTAIGDRFTRALAYGCSLASLAKDHVPLENILADALPPQQKKLAKTITMAILNTIGLLLAALLQRYIMTAHCAIRGAQMFVEHMIIFGREAKLVESHVSMDTKQGKLLIGAVACLGFLWQASQNFALPWPLNILLFPLTVAEWLLGVFLHCFYSARFL